MESQLPVPQPSQEMGAYGPQVLPPKPEVIPAVAVSPERAPQQEQQPVAAVQAPPALPIPSQPPVQQVAAPPVPVLHPLAGTNDNPATAADEDLIEKEWVDKAKKIITQTKDDPYQQEKEVSKLQADYLKKRYGKEVKVASD